VSQYEIMLTYIQRAALLDPSETYDLDIELKKRALAGYISLRSLTLFLPVPRDAHDGSCLPVFSPDNRDLLIEQFLRMSTDQASKIDPRTLWSSIKRYMVVSSRELFYWGWAAKWVATERVNAGC